ncbi:hypothetical protein [Brachybacterium squillarum]|uniref:hypothetical protein n=1 Tax=Brachybacterium squillarum TaxID=661979 RepID=UPI00222358FF|nr:hypothetical protein [Brachybacterium squillarum]MCW1805012.1 hypothetical protein [Brachybacterium squillarum]
MSDGDTTAPGQRRRPTYGLPAPTPEPGDAAAPGAYGSPAPQGRYGSPAPQDPFGGPAPQGQYESPAPQGEFGSPAPQGQFGSPAPHEPAAWTSHGAAPAPMGGPSAPAPARRRRGLVPLIIGLALLIIVGPAAAVGGIIWGFSGVMGQATDGPTVVQGASGTVEMGANEMLILYVPTADAGATCTVEGASPSDLTTVPTSGTITAPDGTSYEQSLGVVATADTNATITCTGTEAPAYMGPLDVFGIALPLILGPIIGVVVGLVGLVLAIVGAVLLVRSRRS